MTLAERARGPVVCVGETLLHLVGDPSLLEAEALVFEAGGAAVEVAAELARHGVEARVSAPVGDDALAARLEREIARLGVDASGLRRLAGKRTGILLHARGADRQVVAYRDLELETDVDPSALEGARHLHLANLLPSAEHLGAQAELAARARGRGRGTSLDLNARPNLFRTRTGLGFQAALARLVAEVDWVKASDDDLERLGVDEAALLGWLRPGALGFVTLAERGVRVTGPRGVLERPPPRQVERGMGAGDAFVAALLRSHEADLELEALDALLASAQEAALARLERGRLG